MKSVEFITESITAPYKLIYNGTVTFQIKNTNRRRRTGASGKFTTDEGIEYFVFAYRLGDTKAERHAKQSDDSYNFVTRVGLGGIWEIHFAAKDQAAGNWKSRATGTGDAFRVFATVVEFCKRLINDREPTVLSIKSTVEEPRRASLYDRLAGRFASSLGYRVVKSTTVGNRVRMELRRIDN